MATVQIPHSGKTPLQVQRGEFLYNSYALFYKYNLCPFFNLFQPLIPILGINRTPFENAFLSSDRQSASVRLPGDLPSRRQLVRPARRVVFRLGAIQLLDSQPEEGHGGCVRGQGAAHKNRRGHQHGWERQ